METSRKVLVVDSDVDRAGLAAAALRARGWEPVITRDAMHAFSVALKLRPSLIVLRDQVAGGGAPVALNRLRNSVHTAATHVVVVGTEGGRRPSEILEAGAQVSLPGDTTPEALCEAAERARVATAGPDQAPAATLGLPARMDAVLRHLKAATRADSGLQDLTTLASTLLGTGGSLLTLVSTDRQTFLTQTGLPEPAATSRTTPLSHSFCQWVVSGREPVLVDDARTHEVLRTNQAIQSLGVVAYAGVPISAGEDHTLGSFCLVDPAPRTWGAKDLLVLKALGKMVEAELVANVPRSLKPGRVFVVIGHGISAAGSLLRQVGAIQPEAQLVVQRFLEKQSRELMVQSLGYSAGNSGAANQH